MGRVRKKEDNEIDQKKKKKARKNIQTSRRVEKVVVVGSHSRIIRDDLD